MNINRLKTDRKKEEGGVWVDYTTGRVCAPGEPNPLGLFRVLVARTGNARFVQKSQELSLPHLSLLRDSNDVALLSSITLEAAAHTILLGWENMTESDEPGAPQVPYSPEKAAQLFRDVPDFYRDVMAFANRRSTYQSACDASAAKNSPTTSTGTSSGAPSSTSSGASGGPEGG